MKITQLNGTKSRPLLVSKGVMVGGSIMQIVPKGTSLVVQCLRNPWLFHFNVWQNSLQIKKKGKQTNKQTKTKKKESTFQCRGCGSIPGRETKIPYAAQQLSPWATTTSMRLNHRAGVRQLRPDATKDKWRNFFFKEKASSTGRAMPATSAAVWVCAWYPASCSSSTAPSARRAASRCSARNSLTAWGQSV